MDLYGYMTGRRGSGPANWRDQIRQDPNQTDGDAHRIRQTETNRCCASPNHKCCASPNQSDGDGHRCSQSVFVRALVFALTIVGPCSQHEEALNPSLESDTREEKDDLGENRFLALSLLLV